MRKAVDRERIAEMEGYGAPRCANEARLRERAGIVLRALALLVPGRHVACDAVNAPSGHGAAQKASTKERTHAV